MIAMLVSDPGLYSYLITSVLNLTFQSQCYFNLHSPRQWIVMAPPLFYISMDYVCCEEISVRQDIFGDLVVESRYPSGGVCSCFGSSPAFGTLGVV